MGSKFQETLSKQSEYYVIRLISSLIGLVAYFSIIMVMMAIFVWIVEINILSAGLLISLIAIAIVSVIRLFWWVYKTIKNLWTRFKPTYASEDFEFTIAGGAEEYSHEPENSALRLPIAINFMAMIMWSAFHSIIGSNIEVIMNMLNWLLNFLPSIALETVALIFSTLFGTPSPNQVSEVGFESFLLISLGLPSIILGTTIVWNLLYYIDSYIYSDINGEGENDPINGSLFLSASDELILLLGSIASIIIGIYRGMKSSFWNIIYWAIVPFLLAVLFVNLVQYFV